MSTPSRLVQLGPDWPLCRRGTLVCFCFFSPPGVKLKTCLRYLEMFSSPPPAAACFDLPLLQTLEPAAPSHFLLLTASFSQCFSSQHGNLRGPGEKPEPRPGGLGQSEPPQQQNSRPVPAGSCGFQFRLVASSQQSEAESGRRSAQLAGGLGTGSAPPVGTEASC